MDKTNITPCDECDNFRMKKWKLCAKCAREIPENVTNDEIREKIIVAIDNFLPKYKSMKNVLNITYAIMNLYINHIDSSRVEGSKMLHEIMSEIIKITGNRFIFLRIKDENSDFIRHLRNNDFNFKNIGVNTDFSKTVVLFQEDIENMFPVLKLYNNWTKILEPINFYYNTKNIYKLLNDFPVELDRIHKFESIFRDLGEIKTGVEQSDIFNAILFRSQIVPSAKLIEKQIDHVETNNKSQWIEFKLCGRILYKSVSKTEVEKFMYDFDKKDESLTSAYLNIFNNHPENMNKKLIIYNRLATLNLDIINEDAVVNYLNILFTYLSLNKRYDIKQYMLRTRMIENTTDKMHQELILKIKFKLIKDNYYFKYLHIDPRELGNDGKECDYEFVTKDNINMLFTNDKDHFLFRVKINLP